MANCDVCGATLQSGEVQDWRGNISTVDVCPNQHEVISEVTLLNDTIKIDEALSRLVRVVATNSFDGSLDLTLPEITPEMVASTVTVEKVPQIKTYYKWVETTDTTARNTEAYLTIEEISVKDKDHTVEEGDVYQIKEKYYKYTSYTVDTTNPLYPVIKVTVTPDADQLSAYGPYSQVSIDGKWYDANILLKPIEFLLCKEHCIKIFWNIGVDVKTDVETFVFSF